MAARIRVVDHFHATLRDVPGAAYRLLDALARNGVNLLAFTAVPVGADYTQLGLFPEDSELFRRTVTAAGLEVTGPDRVLLVQGDDELGTAAGIHQRLDDAHVIPFATTGVTDGRGGFGYLVYVRSQEFQRAADALGI